MNQPLRNNYRMGGYLLIAIGLINWQYQNDDAGINISYWDDEVELLNETG